MYKSLVDRAVYTRIPITGRRITLCGSSRFPEAFEYWNAQLTLAGNIVYSIALMPHHANISGELSQSEKELLDDVHLKKIDNSDAIFVVDIGGYTGESTQREIAYAIGRGKEVYRLSEFTVSGFEPTRQYA
jgi:hypothetical protein